MDEAGEVGRVLVMQGLRHTLRCLHFSPVGCREPQGLGEIQEAGVLGKDNVEREFYQILAELEETLVFSVYKQNTKERKGCQVPQSSGFSSCIVSQFLTDAHNKIK